MSSTTGGGFIFVNACGKSANDYKASTLARAFVMRNVRSTKKWTKKGKAATENRQTPAATAPPTAADDSPNGTPGVEVMFQSELSIVRPRPQRWPTCCHCQRRRRGSDERKSATFVCDGCQISPRTAVVGKLDPFSCMAVQFDEKSNILLSYFMSVIAPNLFPVPSTPKPTAIRKFHQCWLSPSLKQPAFVHALLSLTALQLAVVQPNMKPSPEVMAAYHRIQAIKALKDALANPKQAISDETIATVFHLLCFEENLFNYSTTMKHVQPDAVQRAAHVAGLREMIRLRGGIAGLSTRTGKMLQALILRHTVAHTATSFHAAYRVPRNLLENLYNYPMCSRFFHDPTPVADRCQSVGMNGDLVQMVKCAECLFKDTELYAENPAISEYEDRDMQTLFSGQVGVFLGWYLEAEAIGTLRPDEGLTVFIVSFLLAIIYKSKFIATGSARSRALPRLYRHLRDPRAMDTLRQAGLDIWVAVVVVMMSTREYIDRFWPVWLDTLDQRNPPIASLDDLKVALNQGIWISTTHDLYAECVWETTLLDQIRRQGKTSPTRMKDDPHSWTMERVASKFTSPNPYVNFETLSWAPVDEQGSEYSL